MEQSSRRIHPFSKRAMRKLGAAVGMSRKHYSPKFIFDTLVYERKALVPRRRNGPGFELESFTHKEKLLRLLAQKRSWSELDANARGRVVDVIINGAIEHALAEKNAGRSKKRPSIGTPSIRGSPTHESVYHLIDEVIVELYEQTSILEDQIASLNHARGNRDLRAKLVAQQQTVENLKTYYENAIKSFRNGWGKVPL